LSVNGQVHDCAGNNEGSVGSEILLEGAEVAPWAMKYFSVGGMPILC